VIDVAISDVVDRFELGKKVTNQGIIAISPDDNKLYLPSGITETSYVRPYDGVNKVFVVNLAQKSVTAEIEVTGGPIAVRLSHDGQLGYVSTFAAKKVFVVDLTNNTIVGQIEWGRVLEGEEWRRSDLRDMVTTPDGKQLYITGWDADAVIVADLATRRMSSIIDLNKVATYLYEIAITPDGRSVVVTPDGSRAYVSRQNNPYDTGGIVVIDTATDQIIETINPPTGTSGTIGRFDLLVAARSGAYIYWATDGPGVNVIEVATNKVVKTIDLRMQVVDREWGSPRGIHPTDIAFTSDGSRGYIPCGDAYYVAIVDVATGTVIDRIIDVGIEPVAIVIAPDDRFAYVTNKEGENVSVIDLATNKVIASISTGN